MCHQTLGHPEHKALHRCNYRKGRDTELGRGSAYQAAILGNSGVRISWVMMNQAIAMRLPATPP